MSRYLKGRGYALQMVAIEFAVSLLLAAGGFLIDDQIAFSLLIGGLVCTAANAWLAVVAFRPRLGEAPGKMLAAFYTGELGKFVLVALLFVLAFRRLEWLKDADNALALFAGYLVAQAVVWVYPLFKR